jgi:alkylated DNA repair dioxygenase AlkB
LRPGAFGGQPVCRSPKRPNLTTSFGWRYDFDNASFGPAEPMPEWLTPMRRRAAAFAGLAADDLVQALLIRYDPGAGIGWHRDRPIFEHVIGISLSAPARLRLRTRRPEGFERYRHRWRCARSII